MVLHLKLVMAERKKYIRVTKARGYYAQQKYYAYDSCSNKVVVEVCQCSGSAGKPNEN